MKSQQKFQQDFLLKFKVLGEDSFNRYAPLVQHYCSIIIPFEKRRISDHPNLIFQNSSLEKDKMGLLIDMQKLKAENNRLHQALQKQKEKIEQLNRQIQQLSWTNLDKTSVIQSLRVTHKNLKDALEAKLVDIKQVERDKQALFEKYEIKSFEYNILLANYIKDKDLMAEKWIKIKESQQILLKQEKELKAEKFYLQTLWEEFQEKKKRDAPQINTQQKIYGSKITKLVLLQSEKNKKQNNIKQHKYQAQSSIQNNKQKSEDSQALRHPLKKVIKHHNSEIYDLSFNYNGNLLATCGGDRQIKLFDVTNLKQTISIQSNSVQNIYISVALNYGGERFLAGSTDKVVTVFDSQSGKPVHSFLGHGDKVNSVTWCNSRQNCVSGSQDKQLKVWEVEKARNSLSFTCGSGVKIVTSNHVEPLVYTGHSDGSIRIYSIVQVNSPVSYIKGIIDYPITSISLLSNRHQVLASSTQGSCIYLLDMKMNKSIGKFEYSDFFNSATHAAVSPSENLVVAGNCDGSLYYWNRLRGGLVRRVTGHDGQITALKYHCMSNILASTDKSGGLIIWQ